MAKVDRLGWVDGVSFNPYGTPLGIRTSDSAVLPFLRDTVGQAGFEVDETEVVEILFSLRVAPEASRGRRHYHLVYFNSDLALRSLDFQDVKQYFREAFPALLAAFASDRLFFSGSVVRWREEVLVLPAAEGSGHSTLLGAISEAGGEIIHSGLIPYGREGRLMVEGVAQDRALTTVYTEYSARNRGLRCRTLSTAEAAQKLMAVTVTARRNPQFALAAAIQLAARSRNLAGRRGGDPGRDAAYLAGLLSGSGAPEKGD